MHAACRSNFIWQSHHVISDTVFSNGQQINSERKTKKIITETQTYRSDSSWFLHHLDPILCSNFSCRSGSTEKPILAVTDLILVVARSAISILCVCILLSYRKYRTLQGPSHVEVNFDKLWQKTPFWVSKFEEKFVQIYTLETCKNKTSYP